MLRAIMFVGRFIPPIGRLAARIGGAMQTAGLKAGGAKGPIGLILVSFGVDPMTGRAAAAAVGHGFVAGWAVAIAGDMLYFGVLMISTLWLHSVVGSERITVALMLVFMLVLPSVLRRWQGEQTPPGGQRLRGGAAPGVPGSGPDTSRAADSPSRGSARRGR
jgi:hypothetical protein